MILDNRLVMVPDFYGPINNKHYLYVFTIILPMNNMACGIIGWIVSLKQIETFTYYFSKKKKKKKWNLPRNIISP